MKRIKLMLTGLVVFALVGGALAFNAKKFSSSCVYSLNAAGTQCSLLSTTVYDENILSPIIKGKFVNKPVQGCTTVGTGLPATTPVADCQGDIRPKAEN